MKHLHTYTSIFNYLQRRYRKTEEHMELLLGAKGPSLSLSAHLPSSRVAVELLVGGLH